MKKPVIRPYAWIDSLSEDAMTAIGFRFTALDLDRTKENWLRLYCTWTAEGEASYKTKYPTLDGSCSSSGGGSQNSGIQLAFKDIPAPYADGGADHKAGIELGIGIRTGRRLNPPRLGYSYSHFDRIKYGVRVWFHPPDWNDGVGDKCLSKWGRG